MERFVLMKQGAEAKIYHGHFHGKPCIVKERFPKAYRHPQLDQEITKDRLKGEVRSLVRSRFAGNVLYAKTYLWFVLANQTVLRSACPNRLQC